MTTPAEDGLFMPAEWVRHARCWMAWPCRRSLWGARIDEARAAFAEVARTIARFEPVSMIARPELGAQARAMCGPAVEIVEMPHDDSWTRDTGPLFVIDGKGGVAGVSWRFNGWGGRYPDCAEDARMAGRILARLSMRRYDAPFVLEGGAVTTDGEGTALATEQCLLNPNRNGEVGKSEVEGWLAAYLGVRKVIWLARGLEGDETEGHVDNIACFARPGLVLALVTDDPADGNYRALAENRARLARARDARGRAIDVIALAQPPRRDGARGRLPLSYVNLYLANGAVVVPTFGVREDRRALERIARAFPGRRVAAVEAGTIVEGGGGIHCITQQQPAGAALG